MFFYFFLYNIIKVNRFFIYFIVLSHLIFSFSRIRSLLGPYRKVSTKSIDSILLYNLNLTLFRMGLYGAAHGWRGGVGDWRYQQNLLTWQHDSNYTVNVNYIVNVTKKAFWRDNMTQINSKCDNVTKVW